MEVGAEGFDAVGGVADEGGQAVGEGLFLAAYTGIAPGTYTLRRQREQAYEERLVAD